MRNAFFAFLLFTCYAAPAQEVADSKVKELVFVSVNVIPMETERVLFNKVVVVKNGRIHFIGDPGKVTYGKDAQVIDGSNKYLMPGLAEMHAHVPPNDDLTAIKEVLTLFVAGGVTTIRGMLGHPFHIGIRKSIATHELLGPRLYTSGPSFNGNSVKTVEEAIQKVTDQKKAGYDFLKMHPGLSKETFAAVAGTATKLKIPFAGHVSYQVGIWRAIEARYAAIDHLDGFVDALVPGIDTIKESDIGLFGMFLAPRASVQKIPALMQALKKKNVWVVPTQTLAERWFAPDTEADWFNRQPEKIYIKPSVRSAWGNTKKNLLENPRYDASAMTAYIQLRRQLIKACQQNGVGLLLGSDAPQVFNVPGFSVHDELESYVRAGLTPYQSLVTGTVNAGKFLGMPNLGVIKKGAIADLILLEGNPLKDITQTRRIAGVVVDGRWLSKEWITAARLAIAAQY